MRILVVEDDIQLQQQLQQALVAEKFVVDVASDGEDGLFQASEIPYDAAVIDLGLPKLDGVSLITELRKQQVNFPIIILTARDHWQEKVNGLNSGADDYLTKPFQTQELVARLNALIRRSVGQASPIIKNDAIELNTQSQQVSVNNEVVSISAMEYRLLEFLMLHPEHVYSKPALTEHLYDQDFDLDSNVIEVFVGRLRKKIDPSNELKFIETMRGQGYRLRKLN